MLDQHLILQVVTPTDLRHTLGPDFESESTITFREQVDITWQEHRGTIRLPTNLILMRQLAM